MALWAVEILLAALVVAGWVTQVLKPLLRGDPLFPLFWSKARKLEMKEKRLRQQIHEHSLEDAVEDLEETEAKARKRKSKETECQHE